MKRKFLNIISCFLALFIFVGSFLFYVPSSVSAAVDVSSFPSVFFDPSSSQSSYQECIDALIENESISNLGDCFILINRSSQVEIMIFKDFNSSFTVHDNYNGLDASFFVPSEFGMFTTSFSNLSSYNFILDSVSLPSPSTVSWNSPRCLGVYNTSFPYIPCILDSNHDIRDRNPNYHCFYSSVTPPFTPDYSLTGVIVGFDFSVEAFTQWLIDTGKYHELPVYIGTAKLKSFVQFYHDWGTSNNIFIVKLLEWLMHFNIGFQTLENRNILKSTIDRLYQEYCNQGFVTIQNDSSRLPHHRQNIETVTTDDDLSLVTDDANDDIYTSLLRDILRGVISIPVQIYNCTEMIISKLDYLNWNVTVSNDGGSSVTDLSPVLNKMDDIIDKLEVDTVSVDIDQTTQDDTDQFFDDWNLEFSTALNNKFPVASQLSTLFTDFWEKCGVDADGDGETFEYYNPGVLTASVTRSGSVGVSESDAVSEFLGKFDDADPSFLDDASFNSVPDLSVTVGGHSVSILDFRVYAKYRDKIHFIISFVIWTLYLLHLYKALPSIIGQVADVATKTSEL